LSELWYKECMTVIQYAASICERLLVSPDSAQAVLSMRFPPDDERRMQELMEKNNQGTILDEEKTEMEAFRRIGSILAIMQAKARLLPKCV
jgi:hypothetical protein